MGRCTFSGGGESITETVRNSLESVNVNHDDNCDYGRGSNNTEMHQLRNNYTVGGAYKSYSSFYL